MGTRSCVIIKVRKEDIGKVMKFQAKALPVKLASWADETTSSKCKPVEIDSAYVGIYCHWDGYPSGVGAALLNKFHTYDEVLNLVLGGSCSHIDESDVRHYANRKGEKWNWIKPMQDKTEKGLVNYFDGAWAEYAYLFDEERGWRYKKISSRDFKPLTL
jgi:hypothetical protein